VTIWDLMSVLRRRWIVVLVGLAVTAGAVQAISGRPGVFYQQVDVIFIAPTGADGNALQNVSDSLIDTAGVVGAILKEGNDSPVSSSSATLVGRGVTRGYSITLPNQGGQWASNFDRPVLDVQVVGPSEADVQLLTRQAVRQIDEALTGLQDRYRVGRAERITTQVNPRFPILIHDRGQPTRAVAVAGMLGLLVTVGAALQVERFRRGRRRPTAGAPTPVAVAPGT
jgi:hypothetical protein